MKELTCAQEEPTHPLLQAETVRGLLMNHHSKAKLLYAIDCLLLKRLCRRKSTKSLSPHDYNPSALMTEGHWGRAAQFPVLQSPAGVVQRVTRCTRPAPPLVLDSPTPCCRDGESLLDITQCLPTLFCTPPGQRSSLCKEYMAEEQGCSRIASDQLPRRDPNRSSTTDFQAPTLLDSTAVMGHCACSILLFIRSRAQLAVQTPLSRGLTGSK